MIYGMMWNDLYLLCCVFSEHYSSRWICCLFDISTMSFLVVIKIHFTYMSMVQNRYARINCICIWGLHVIFAFFRCHMWSVFTACRRVTFSIALPNVINAMNAYNLKKWLWSVFVIDITKHVTKLLWVSRNISLLSQRLFW